MTDAIEVENRSSGGAAALVLSATIGAVAALHPAAYIEVGAGQAVVTNESASVTAQRRHVPAVEPDVIVDSPPFTSDALRDFAARRFERRGRWAR